MKLSGTTRPRACCYRRSSPIAEAAASAWIDVAVVDHLPPRPVGAVGYPAKQSACNSVRTD